MSSDTERQATSGEVKELRREMSDLKEALAVVLLESRLLKKASLWMGPRYMRYPASEKLEIIRLIEKSHLPVKNTLA